jgi:glutamate synthase (NADPH) small chain
MGKPSGFMEFARQTAKKRAPEQRVQDFQEFENRLPLNVLQEQGARCMNCGIPFCHTGGMIGNMAAGCPLNNLIPEWNDLVYRDSWAAAYDRLDQTNPFPEFTGRVCPAPCEGSCCLGVNEPPVTIKSIECEIIDRAWDEGWVTPKPPQFATGKKVAVVGSGPAGLACAQGLRRLGHDVTVFERDDRIGGLLMYGIPNMKLDKQIVQRRVDQMTAEGVRFVTGVEVGKDVTANQLQAEHDAVVLAIGSTRPMDLKIPGRDLRGVHLAMEYLVANTKSLLNSQFADDKFINPHDKQVVVIGGGDTGNDCLGTSVRHGCKSLINLEIVPQPPVGRAANNPWPQWPRIFRVDYGHEEAAAIFGNDPRQFGVQTLAFLGNDQGQLTGLRVQQVDWTRPSPGAPFSAVEGSERILPADLVFLALGFVGPDATIAQQLGLTLDRRGNIQATLGDFTTNVPGVFSVGDCRRGQSLVVWAMREGRDAALVVQQYLTTLVNQS